MAHHEICRYGTLATWAKELGLDEAVELLEQTLEEEKATDEALTELSVVFRRRARQERSEVARRERLRPRQIPGHWSARQILGYLVLE